MQKRDTTTSIAELQELITNFRKARNWDIKYSDPYDIAAALSVEAAEILELLLWQKNADVKQLIAQEPKLKEKLANEIADVLAFILVLSDSLNIDLSDVFLQKMATNADKYPIIEGESKPRKRWLE